MVYWLRRLRAYPPLSSSVTADDPFRIATGRRLGLLRASNHTFHLLCCLCSMCLSPQMRVSVGTKLRLEAKVGCVTRCGRTNVSAYSFYFPRVLFSLPALSVFRNFRLFHSSRVLFQFSFGFFGDGMQSSEASLGGWGCRT